MQHQPGLPEGGVSRLGAHEAEQQFGLMRGVPQPLHAEQGLEVGVHAGEYLRKHPAGRRVTAVIAPPENRLELLLGQLQFVFVIVIEQERVRQLAQQQRLLYFVN